ncbi:Alpha/Beta hydrolase protein [Polychytrium aggregatum]|uniref:Alpha/Beta hydrolase protein n=1 Tax=Polychytrium aggregatum TaxID=110093 RepID=UPI0022FF44EE|nr:Alpha/Beta hydrolase protein [Polychytrium aggregatum]KAI9190847.1 Alpha/Beta hydrolase protein [Polychytrium aggregatum]
MFTGFDSPSKALVQGSFAGYINVGPVANQSYVANTFFWYFPTRASPSNPRNVIFYFQGGPGCSSLVSLFQEVGPLHYYPTNGSVFVNPQSWDLQADIVFVDSPVGTGFSYTNSGGPATDERQIGEMLYSFIRRFLVTFSGLEGANVILAGESYAGITLPYLAQTIQLRNDIASYTSNGVINLKALLLMSPWIQPKNQYPGYFRYIMSNWATQLNNNQTALTALQGINSACQAQISALGPVTYIAICESLLDYMRLFISDLTNGTQCFNEYNVRSGTQDICPTSFTNGDVVLIGFLNSLIFRLTTHNFILGAPRTYIACSNLVQQALEPDGSPASDTVLTQLLNAGLNVYITSSQFDIVSSSIGLDAMIASLTWQGKTGFTSSNQTWTNSDGSQLGSVTSDRGLTHFRVLNAGHSMPQDNPAAASAVLRKVLSDISIAAALI